MDFFPALGLAVLGIFATVMLTGILAGIIAFGFIDGGMRSQIQRGVVARLVDNPVDRFWVHDLRGLEAAEREASRSWWGSQTFKMFRDGPEGVTLAKAIRRDPSSLFRLPYRQLCAQIANVVANELYEPEWTEDRSNRSCPATMLLLISDLASNRDYDTGEPPLERLARLPVGVAKLRAMGFVDTIQIALAEEVQRKAGHVAIVVILIVFTGILVPSINALNLLAENGSLMLRSVGEILALLAAQIIILMLSAATRIVATLTFRWIDGFASAR